jgi:hypothetical protein
VEVRGVGFGDPRAFGVRPGGARARGGAAAVHRVARALGAGSVPERLAPVAALVPDLGRWNAAERRALLALLRDKELPRERPFVLAMQRHEQWRRWLLATFPTHGT